MLGAESHPLPSVTYEVTFARRKRLCATHCIGNRGLFLRLSACCQRESLPNRLKHLELPQSSQAQFLATPLPPAPPNLGVVPPSPNPQMPAGVTANINSSPPTQTTPSAIPLGTASLAPSLQTLGRSTSSPPPAPLSNTLSNALGLPGPAQREQWRH
jgi:hypothetical protein